ncbi:sigma-54-dependent transcriptional regulator [Thioclava indica]|uniref:sigma-54-dependent transcriptional regulator n=1 Tax=Thioclava indica TaxID=1353528 RepID=UPI0023E4459D|nr:sigma-54 dependent transcriptional regulator [Thioclava indica]
MLVEDVASLRAIYEAHLSNAGFEVHTAASASDAMALFRAHPVEIVLLDLMLPDRDGDELIPEMLALRGRTAILVFTADRSVDRAVNAMRAGALDVLIKPVSEARLSSAIENARSFAMQADPQSDAQNAPTIGAFIGQSPHMQKVYDKIRAAARSVAPLFIWGESGTGKELCAHATHALGSRAKAPFVTLDCGALPADRLDSELFGHRQGAFPGALSDKPGALLSANGGSLLLDNVCELDPTVQTKLLRFLESGHIKPFGAVEPVQVDVRVISAAARSPMEVVDRGQMREDLQYRLHVLSIEMPPLREHPEDIETIAHEALARFSTEEQRSFTSITPEAMAWLQSHSWPGNVRQLMNVLRAAVVMHDGPELSVDMLPDGIHCAPRSAGASASAPSANTQPVIRTLAEIEREAIEAAIERHDGSIPRAAQELGVAPSTIYRKRETWERDTPSTP